MPIGNKGLCRFNGPQQPGQFPWNGKIHAYGLLANRPAACPALLGFQYLASDVSGGTLYQCVLSNGRAAWALTSTSAAGREFLTAPRTYYVRTDGSDSNTGSANTAAGAFLTIQKAVDVASSLDNNALDITISVAAGTYGGVVARSFVGSGKIIILGDEGTPANVIISVADNFCVQSVSVTGVYSVRGVKLLASGGSGYGLAARKGSLLEYQNVNFGAMTSSQVLADDGGQVTCTGNYTISGGGARHMDISRAGRVIAAGFTITLTGTPAFSGSFLFMTALAVANLSSNTYSGAATGAKYSINGNSVADTAGAGTAYLPGDAASGTTNTGGQYL